MRNLLLYVVVVGTVFRAGHTSSPEQAVVKKVGGEVSLDCPSLDANEEYSSVMWNKNTVFFLTADKNQQVNFASNSLSARVSLSSKHQLVVADLEMSDSGNYSCQISVNKSGTWELQENVHILTVQDVPSAPGKPVVGEVQSRQVTATWTASESNNSPISAYILSVRECQGGSNVQELSTQTVLLQLTVDGLSPYTCYTAAVSAVNGVGRSSLSEESNQFYTREEDSVALTWQCQHPPEVVTSLTILLVAAAGDSRLLGWTIILACLQLPAQVWGLDEEYLDDENDTPTPVGEDMAEEHFVGGTTSSVTTQQMEPDCVSQASVTFELWSAVGIIVILLTLYYRFELCGACLKVQHKYSHLSREDLSLSVQEEPVEIQQATELQHPAECGTTAYLRNRTVAGFSYGDMSASDLLSHVRSLQQEGGRGFSEEFLKLADMTQDENFPADHSNLAENECKNRYRNITAYDNSRVILRTGKSSLGQSDPVSSSLGQSDYINANYIQGYQKGQTYIATQGPLPRTVADFWLMVWENNSSVIVMLTNLVENGKAKCEQYWPSRGEAAYGELRVRLVWTDCRAFFTIRQLLVLGAGHQGTKRAAERMVYHYHYTQWPDHGVPDYSLPVLSFVQKSAAQSGPDNGPIIVHCSAGVGRTGTYIVIHSMLAQLRHKQTVNILGFIQDIRRQRNFLVQTESQLKLIHEVLVDYLVANGNTEVTEIQVLDYLMQPYKGMSPTSQSSPLKEQFKQITGYTPKELEFSAALEPINQSKNRIHSILPVNSSRVVLPDRPAFDSSDYINASFMQGFRDAKEFIVTQRPMEETVEDFWWMVWHVQSPVIVLLSAGKDKESKRFWPKFGASIKLDNTGLIVASRDEPVSGSPHCLRILELVVKFNKNETHLLTRIMVLKDGPICSMKLDTMFDPISAAQSYLTTRLECGPITVVDRFGGVEAGTFCALWTLRDQLLCERSADFYQVCKLYHYKRPGIFASQEDYLLLHHAVAAQFKHLQDTPTPTTTC